MKVLIGTPVHESKDYGMDRWIKSVSKLDHPFDLLMVDNSINSNYVNTLHKYCKKHRVTNYKLIHIDVSQNTILDERLARSREIIRQEVLNKNYDAWFSLECDIITPPNALTKLTNLINNYWMISHGYPSRDNPNASNAELGITLIKQAVLKKYGFTNQYGYVDPLLPNCWYSSDVWFIRQIQRNKDGKNINIHGIIKPIYHLAK
jgi:hypothetical protein